MAEELSEISKFVSSYWNYYLELEEAFKHTQKYVAFDRHNDRTYSVEYLKLIQAVCSEIDVVAKEIAEHFDPDFCTIQRPTISHWGYVLINNMPQIAKARIHFTNGYVVKPWDKFGYTQYSDKKGNIRYKLLPNCDTPSWWSDYNKMKHQRTSRNADGEINFVKANLKKYGFVIGSTIYSMEWLYMWSIHTEFGPKIVESSVFDLIYSDSVEDIGGT